MYINSNKPSGFSTGLALQPEATKRSPGALPGTSPSTSPDKGSSKTNKGNSGSGLNLGTVADFASALDPNGVGKVASLAKQSMNFVNNVQNGKLKGTDTVLGAINLVGKFDDSGGMAQSANLVGQGINFVKNVQNGSLKGTDAARTGLGLVGQLGGDDVGKLTNIADQGLRFAKDVKSGSLRGTDATASALGLAGTAIGGEVGQKLALGGDIVGKAASISANTVPGAATGNIVGLGFNVAELFGAKIDPGVSSMANLGVSVLAGPVGWLGAGVQILSSLLSMGDHNKTVELQKSINATGRIPEDEDEDGDGEVDEDKPTDTSSIFDHTNTGFLNIGSSHSSSMQYDTTGGTIDPRLLKDVEFKIEDRPNTRSGMFGMFNENAGKKQITIKANYDGINPATGGASGETKIDLNPEQVEAYKKVLGGESGKIDPKDLQKMAVVQPQINDMKITFKQKENDPTLYNYKDVNGDGIPDRIAISLNNEGLEKKGDGSVSVTILDKNRNAVGDTLTANGSSKIEDNLKELGEMQKLRPLLETYAASHIETWDGGKDLTSTYRALKANGGLEKLKQVGPALAEYMQARQSPGADVRQPLEKLNGLVKEIGLGFDARAYAAANPDLIKNIGTDPSLLAEHYRNHGNFEGRALNLNGDKAPQWVPPALRNTTVLGSEIGSDVHKNAELKRGESLVSKNGKFMAAMQTDGNLCVYDISGKDKKLLWDAKTNEQRHNGFLGIGGHTTPAAASFSMQADGNLVAYDANHKGQWDAQTGVPGVNRVFKLAMQDDGSLVVKDSQGGANLWSSAGGAKQKAANADGTAPAFQVLAQTPVSYGSEQTRKV
jgi:hypothetical protein